MARVLARHTLLFSTLAALALVLSAGGCDRPADPTDDAVEAETEATEDAVVVLTSDEADAAIAAGDAEPYTLEVCLVSGEPLDSMGGPIAMVYDGKEIQFCCAGCDDMFLEDPQAYLTRLETGDVPYEPLDHDHGHDHDHDHDHDHGDDHDHDHDH